MPLGRGAIAGGGADGGGGGDGGGSKNTKPSAAQNASATVVNAQMKSVSEDVDELVAAIWTGVGKDK